MDNRWRACDRHSVRWAPPLAFPLILGLVGPLGVAARAHAQPQDDGGLLGAQLFHAAEDDERGTTPRGYAKALAEYEGAIAAAPSAAWIPKAQARARILREHSEGDFAPFALLEAVRARPGAADDPKTLADLAARADGFPPGQVRSEARVLVAEAYAGRLHRPAEALPILEQVVADPSADPLTARLSLDMLVAVELDLDDLDAASDAVHRHAKIAEPSLVLRVHTLVRRHALHRAALGVLAAWLVLAAVAIGRAAARGDIGEAVAAVRASYKLIAGFLAYVTIAGAALAMGYEPGTGAPFLVFGAVALPLALAARAWGAVGATQPAARAGRALLCAASVIGAAFLVLEWINVEYLKGFGL